MKNRTTMLILAQEYLAHKRALGFALRIDGRQLLQFAAFADRSGHRGPLTFKLALRWARLPQHVASHYYAKRLDIVRRFAQFRAVFDPKTEVPPLGYLGSPNHRPAPYIYRLTEVRALLKAARRLSPRGGLRPRSYTTLIGLLACTGLRLSEALRLQVDDVDLETGVLLVRQSKFHLTRLVPLHPSAIRALRHYRRGRDKQYPLHRGAFFLSEGGEALNQRTVHQTFTGLRTCLGCFATRRPPRWHDLRHTFACRRLLLWCRQPDHLDNRIVYLSRYLGHRQIAFTYWYLTGVPELFGRVGAHFERYWRSRTCSQK